MVFYSHLYLGDLLRRAFYIDGFPSRTHHEHNGSYIQICDPLAPKNNKNEGYCYVFDLQKSKLTIGKVKIFKNK